jgi:flagella basal body P-ring formation protein FlgA
MKTVIKILILILIVMTLLASAVLSESCDKAVVDRIMDTYSLDSSSYRIDVLSNRLKSKEIRPADLSIKPLTLTDPIGLFTVQATLSVDGDPIETGEVRLRITKYADVAVTTDTFKRHEHLSADRLSIQRMDVTNLREQPVTNLDEVTGTWAKRNIRKGTILTLPAMESIPDVQIGREVLIVYDDGLCRVTAPGIAMQDGSNGDYIRIKNKSTNKVITGKVIDDREVAVAP